ncbi:hypothetical protein LDENG_00044890 [Lucifuga dentata]|nr:hypothetical protein LDENG_00044890 [Lucifuga dentata]
MQTPHRKALPCPGRESNPTPSCEKPRERRTFRCCPAVTANHHQCLGSRVVVSLFLQSTRQCGGVFLGHCCCLHCGGDTPARSTHWTPGVQLHRMACPSSDWKYCTAEHCPAMTSDRVY